MMFIVLKDVEVETLGGTVRLSKGKRVKIDAVEAVPLIEQGYISPFMNPDKKLCRMCNSIAWRYCAGHDRSNRFTWDWWCLKCRPYYSEPERN